MNTSDLRGSCVSCGSTGSDKPLIELSYRDVRMAICPQCLPVLIHHPERLSERLASLLERRPGV